MLANILDQTKIDDSREVICSSQAVTYWHELRSTYETILSQTTVAAGTRIGFLFSASSVGFAGIAALEKRSANVFLFDANVAADRLEQIANELDLKVCISAETLFLEGLNSTDSTGDSAGGITILTSGTSGKPKAVHHDFSSLVRPVRQTDPGQRWLLAYPPHLYAGLQVTLQALTNYGTLVIPAAGADPQSIAKVMTERSVEFASATPSYWRRLLMAVPPDKLASIPIQQITLGGEVVDQTILDQLRACFPDARIVHIYATSETGRCFSVSDGDAGFPLNLLDAPSNDGVSLRIVDDELQVKSANSMSGYDTRSEAPSDRVTDDGWFRTGDLVEVRGQRVYFSGRASDMINVGGNKVHPIEVERALRMLDEVAEVRVYSQGSSLAGELVACDVVAADKSLDPKLIRTRIMEHCNQALDRYQRPRIVRVLDELDLSDAGKLKRR